jgi:hypothetical protein
MINGVKITKSLSPDFLYFCSPVTDGVNITNGCGGESLSNAVLLAWGDGMPNLTDFKITSTTPEKTPCSTDPAIPTAPFVAPP